MLDQNYYNSCINKIVTFVLFLGNSLFNHDVEINTINSISVITGTIEKRNTNKSEINTHKRDIQNAGFYERLHKI